MSNNNKNKLYSDVVICGGALAGMTLALGFIKKGFNVVIIDPKTVQELISFDKRTTAIAEGPKNFYESIGVWDKVKKYSEPIKTIKIKDGNSNVQLNFDCSQFQDNINIDSLGYVIENIHLLKGINSSINNNKSEGSIKRIKASVVSIESDKHISKVRLSNNNLIFSSLVVACDGKHSVTRKMMGLGTKNFSYKQEAFVCSILHDKSHKNIALEKFLPGGPLAILPMKKFKQKYRSSIIWSDRSDVSKSRYNSSIKNS